MTLTDCPVAPSRTARRSLDSACTVWNVPAAAVAKGLALRDRHPSATAVSILMGSIERGERPEHP